MTINPSLYDFPATFINGAAWSLTILPILASSIDLSQSSFRVIDQYVAATFPDPDIWIDVFSTQRSRFSMSSEEGE